MVTAKKKPVSKVPSQREAAPPRGGRTAGASRRSVTVTPPKPRWSEQYEQAVKEYARAVEQVQRRNWAEAQPLLEELVKRYGEEADLLDITDRARTYLKICARHLHHGGTRSPQGAFLLGVFHSNRGEYDEALRMFEESLAGDPGSDKILYAIAAVRALKGDRGGAIDYLRKAVAADDRNRIYALNDPDFDSIRDEPEFIDLVEPEEAGGRQK
ncbi:MAG: hypothetical protein DMF49_07280 [Acidobacteria bacterium]|nr:MAG: hypothetical protein DMF49_07280 [Acidobacteriota bacterium]